MLNQYIQKVGRLILRVFQFYFETSVFLLYILSMRFQTGRTLFSNQQPLFLAPSLYYNNFFLFSTLFSLGPEYFLGAELTFTLLVYNGYWLASSQSKTESPLLNCELQIKL